MPLNQTNKLSWIVETISRARFITFEDLNRKWVENEDMSHGEELHKRTFHKWRQSIRDTFGLEIECDNSGEYRYYIANLSDMKSGSIEQWLLNTYSISNSIESSKGIRDRIILEDNPSGLAYLDRIISAMKINKTIHIVYYNHWRGDERPHHLMPLCVKLFRQRWYLVGRSCDDGSIKIFSLDRIRELSQDETSFDYPEDFVPEQYFANAFGVIVDERVGVERVRLKVDAHQANYLRTLPIHGGNQREVERNNEYSIFELYIRPTFDFQQEILWNGETMEVLSPQWLRDQVADRIGKMNELYK